MQADDKPWLQHGNPPYGKYFAARIRKECSSSAGPGMKYDGDCRASPDPVGVVRGDLHAMYTECELENPFQGVIANSLAVLQKDVQCGALFGIDANGARLFNMWMQHRPFQLVVGQLAKKKVRNQMKLPITEHKQEDAWHFWHSTVPFPLGIALPEVVEQTFFTHPHSQVLLSPAPSNPAQTREVHAALSSSSDRHPAHLCGWEHLAVRISRGIGVAALPD